MTLRGTNAVPAECDVPMPLPSVTASAVGLDTPLLPLQPDDFQFHGDGLPESSDVLEACFDAGWQLEDNTDLSPSDLQVVTASFVLPVQHCMSWSVVQDLQKPISCSTTV